MKIGYYRYYFFNCLTWDIERQFNKEVEAEKEEYVVPAIAFYILEYVKLAKTFVN